jgi:metal-dependent amidase/aminoacylase/carboxypeptidase family protein
MTTDKDALHAEMTAWRHNLHTYPEFGFEEQRTSAFVAAKLREFGFDEIVEASAAQESSQR